MIKYYYGNGMPIKYERLNVGFGYFEFIKAEEDFLKRIDSGLILNIKKDEGKQSFKFNRDEYRVVPSQYETSVILNDRSLCDAIKLATMLDGFIHIATPAVIELAAQVGQSIIYQLTKPVMKRKNLVVYMSGDFESIAYLIFSAIGHQRIGLTREEFYQRYTPESALQKLISYLRSTDICLEFKKHDKIGRPLFASIIGANRIEFAEQPNT